MTSIDLSSNAREIESAYNSIVDGNPKISWALFSYGAGFNNNTLKLQATGAGDLDELQDEFSDGKIQYAFVRVTDPNTQLPKFVLIGWCGEGVPERAKGYFNSHFNSVARLFHGYHVQITARSEDDVVPEEILRKVADASGSKYSVAELAARFSKPPPVRPKYTESHASSHADEKDWDNAPVPRASEVSKVPPAYKPVKVDLDEIRKSSAPQREYVEPVKSAYQPIGKVDIAAIRSSASKAELEAEKPEIVKGAYQPIGKVDIAAIRAQAKQNEEYTKPVPTTTPESDHEKPPVFKGRLGPFSSGPAERLSELPKPKIDKPALASRFGGTSFATTPPLPRDPIGSQAKVIGGISKNFANEGGKTPSQLWAERKAKAAGGSAPTSSSSSTAASTYSVPKPAASDYDEEQTHSSVSAMRDRFAKATIINGKDENEDKKVSSVAARSNSPIRLANPVSSYSTITRPDSLPPRPLPISPEVEPIREPERELEPEPEPELEPEPLVEEADELPPALNMSSKPNASSFTLPPSNIESELEPDSFQKGQSAAAFAIATGGNVGPGASAAAPQANTEHEDEPAAALGSGKRAIVTYEYQKDEENEINLIEGETIYDIEMIDDGWWAGTNGAGEHGLFPSNYVEILEGGAESKSEVKVEADSPTVVAAPAPAAVVIPKGPSAVAAYEYEAQEDNELSFPEGATIEDIQFPDEDWWSGVYNGERKLFPANYVSLQ
ncbi:hypothetical protein V1525DRAFT_407510 [Lipomyces kononenkoae]|uniref:Uncharacterized protein n=1 Tax=Lipomyces kononenkoae TaxID=34357 RepID=A0ACC3SX94_LIPKO